MHILISSAYPLSSPKGNSITAKRIESLLTQTGNTAQAINTDMPPTADAMISLHATKTLASSKSFKVNSPNGKLIVYLTGTDLYREQTNNNPEFFEALSLADALVVGQRASLASIPTEFLKKSHFIPASVLLPPVDKVSPPPHPSLALIGHLRPVKNPFLMNQALEKLADIKLEAFTLGAALEPSMLSEVQCWQQSNPRFNWLNDVTYSKTLSWIEQVDFTLNTSHSEGGSNAVAESIALGTPVLASKIEGNVGMLGDDYLGYFEPDNVSALAALIRRSITDHSFHSKLLQQIADLQQNFLPAKETAGWLKLLKQPPTELIFHR
ncbi:MAG: glycosyltransferase [Rubritalea sp.]|uniref:glycosyltransferase n=1 Tax=Rubritalea sp. TaxID=2109375 RepID=UPI0032422F54